MTEDQLTGAWRSDAPALARYEIVEADHLIVNEAPGVFVRQNTVYRNTYGLGGELVETEEIARNRALTMCQPFLDA